MGDGRTGWTRCVGGARRLLVATTSSFFLSGVSSPADPGRAPDLQDQCQIAGAVTVFPDQPAGTDATVGVVLAPRALRHQPSLAVFKIDYQPGGAALLHRTPTTGYVVVHVISGTIKAQAWKAGLGT